MVVSKLHPIENELFEIFKSSPETLHRMVTLLGDRARSSRSAEPAIPVQVFTEVEARILRNGADR